MVPLFSDGGNGFILGRRAFSRNIHMSHQSSNLPANNSSNSYKPSTASGIVPKPLNYNNDAGMRLQRLRLSTIGSSSLRVSLSKITILTDLGKGILIFSRDRQSKNNT